jgi:protein TonB
MKKLSLTLILIISTLISTAQTNNVVGIPAEYGTSKDTIGAFVKVEKEADFPGGLPAWRNFLMNNLKGDVVFKDLPKRTKKFEQTAMVQFIVCTDGTVCDVKVINNVLPSIKKEAERAINNSGKWIPAEQGGRKVKAYRKQPITFIVTE